MAAALINTRSIYQNLSTYYLLTAIATWSVIALFIVVFVWRYRARANDGRSVSRRSDNNLLEGAYVVFLACVAAWLLRETYVYFDHTQDAFSIRKPALRVQIVASKWHWTFKYTGTGIVRAGTDQHPPTLVVPLNNYVGFDMTSLDVIHSVWFTHERFKRNAYPDRTASFALAFSQPGFSHDGDCSEFCGYLHASMRFNVLALPMPQFRAWERRMQHKGVAA